MSAAPKIVESIAAQASAVPRVYLAMHAVMSDIGKAGIAKKGRNDSQRFTFRGIDGTYEAVNPLLVQHGLLITPRIVGSKTEERTAKSGGSLFWTVVDVEYTFRSIEDGSTHEVLWKGEAIDQSDKSVSKAISVAFKTMIFQTFVAPVEGQPDADAFSHEVSAAMPTAEWEKLKERVKETGGSVEKWTAYMEQQYPDGVPMSAHAKVSRDIEAAKASREKAAAKSASEPAS